MFWTVGWTAMTGFVTGIGGIVSTAVIAISNQRSASNRERLLAVRKWDEQLFVAQRNAVIEFLTYMPEFRRECLDNLAVLMATVSQQSMRDAYERLRPEVERIKDDPEDKLHELSIPPFLLADSMESPPELPKSASETVHRLALALNRHIVTVGLLIDDADMISSMRQIEYAWAEFSSAWFDLHSLAVNWKLANDSADGFSATDLTIALRKFGKLLETDRAFRKFAGAYFQRGMRE
jgi:hypothetical protein